MNGKRFDGFVKSIGLESSRRGVLRGAAALAAVLLASDRGGTALAGEDPWPCPIGVDGRHRNCMCECTAYGHSAVDCQVACMECQWHVNPVCPNPDERGVPAGPPVCCADRKPCSLVCGDCPDCEPVSDLL